MKHILSLSIVVLFTLNIPVWASPEVGAAAPAFSAMDSHGNIVSLGDYAGKTVVLEWTNHQCPFVRKHYDSDNMQSLQKDTTGKGIVWLSIISSAPGKQGHVSGEEANSIVEKRGSAPSAVILDGQGDIGRAYAAKTTPHMYIINGEGTLLYKGAIDDTPSARPADVKIAKNYVRVALASLAAGEDIAENSTRPYGCSVKY